MSYVIKHPRWGLYAGHELRPSFRRKKLLHEVLEFPTLADAQAVLKDRKKYPGMEDCVIGSKEK